MIERNGGAWLLMSAPDKACNNGDDVVFRHMCICLKDKQAIDRHLGIVCFFFFMILLLCLLVDFMEDLTKPCVSHSTSPHYLKSFGLLQNSNSEL